MAEQETKAVDQELETPEMETPITEDTVEAAQETADAEKADKKGLGKGKKKDKKEDAYKQQIADLEDRVMRQMAEFENYRRRTDKEKTAMFETGARSVIEKILPVVDNFERGFATIVGGNYGTVKNDDAKGVRSGGFGSTN